MDKLGIDPILILVQVINFGLLLFLLKKVLYKPVINAIASRQKKLKEIDEEKVLIEKEKKELEEKKKNLLTELQIEKKKTLEETRYQGEIEKKAILEKANQTAKEILRQTRSQFARDRQKTQRQLVRQANDLALDLVKKIFSESFDKETQRKYTAFAIKKLSETARDELM